MGDTFHLITPGTTFAKGDAYTSCASGGITGTASQLSERLVFQADGNLVMYDASGQAKWQSRTGSGQIPTPGATAAFQADGNLVVYCAAGKPLFASNTSGHPNALLALQNDENVVIYDWPKPLWSMRTSMVDVDNIGLRMQYQYTSDWCWIAVATSVEHFYHPGSVWTQGSLLYAIVTDPNINNWPKTTVCWPTAAELAAHPGLEAKMADPYSPDAHAVLDGVLDAGVTGKTGDSKTALQKLGICNAVSGKLTLDQVTTEIKAGRPVVVDVAWNAGGQHFVVICGVQGQNVLVADPIYGFSTHPYADFPGNYQSGASVQEMCTTKPS